MGGKCKYNSKWENKYNWVAPVNGDPEKAACTLCRTTFKIDSQGENAVTRHRKGESHTVLEGNKAATKPLTNFSQVRYISNAILLFYS